jgi:hypothetical protein
MRSNTSAAASRRRWRVRWPRAWSVRPSPPAAAGTTESLGADIAATLLAAAVANRVFGPIAAHRRVS